MLRYVIVSRPGLEPLKIGLIEDRFEYLSGKTLVKEEKKTTVQSRQQKQHDVPVLPASLETFLQAIELLAAQRQAHFTGFENNVTHSWIEWPTKGVLENVLLDRIAKDI